MGSKQAAEQAKQQIEAKLTLGQWMPAEKTPLPTVQEYYDRVFLPLHIENSGAIALSTADKYRSNFNTHVLPGLGSYHLDAVDYTIMEAFVTGLCNTPRRISHKKGVTPAAQPTLAKATIDTIVTQLKAMFSHAIRRKLITDNPAAGVTHLYKQARKRHEKIDPLTREEVPLFLKAVSEVCQDDYAMFLMFVHAGLRAGEVAGAQSGDIDFNGKYMLVQRSIDQKNRVIKSTKASKIRRVDLSDELSAALKNHIRRIKEVWFKKGKPLPIWLFPNEDGPNQEEKDSGWTDMNNLNSRQFKKCLTKAGLHHRPLHHLRHTYASLMLTAGASMQYVSEQLGHSNIQLTVKLYGHLQPSANRHWTNTLPGAAMPAESAVAAD